MKNILILAGAIAVSAYLIPGVSIAGGITVDGLINLSLVVIALTAVNLFIKPVISLITLPINLITLGGFSLVVNACMILLVDYFLAGFVVSGFVAALLFSIVLSIVRLVLNSFED
jgi:putative membrane protein